MTAATGTVRLEDGRTLEFNEYGAPGGAPVLFFHGFMGSRHQAAIAHESARAQGVRLIAPNRPGVGRSSPFRYRQVTDFAGDVEQLADRLALREFGLLAVSGGCPYALACAYRMPARARLVAVVSGLGPLAGTRSLWRMPPLARFALLLSHYCPPVARWVIRSRLRHYQSSPERYPNGVMEARCAADQVMFADPCFLKVLHADLEDVLVRGAGVRALVWEMQLFFNWGFRVQDLPGTTRVLFWHGRDDSFVPPCMSRYMAEHIPNSEAAFIPGGHFLAAHIVPEVLSRLGSALHGRPR
jgi:pimeloyl-ACP methyl ester carboxylesterase